MKINTINSGIFLFILLEKMDNFAIIFGNEGNGVSEDILSLCDEVIKINMNSKCESLNVAVSSGIVLYNLWSKNE